MPFRRGNSVAATGLTKERRPQEAVALLLYVLVLFPPPLTKMLSAIEAICCILLRNFEANI